MSDPGWLYSSIAQVAAAIIGLVGALLGSRLIDHLRTQQAERRKLEQAIFPIMAEPKAEIAGWIERMGFLKETIQKRGKPGVTAIPDAEQQLEKLRKLIGLAPTFQGAVGSLRLPELQKHIDDLSGTYLHASVVRFMDRLTKIERQISTYRSGLLPNMFFFLFVVLVWLSVVGVIWPLMALPGLPTSSFFGKRWIMFAFSFGLVALCLYFIRLFLEARKLGNVEWPHW